MKNKLLGFLLVAQLAVMNAPALADDWSHVRLADQNGNRITIDYIYNVGADGGSNYKPQFRDIARPVYINISGENLLPTDHIRVVLDNWANINREDIPYNDYKHFPPITYILDLAWQNDHFSGNLDNAKVNQAYMNLGDGAGRPLVVFSHGYAGNFYSRQKLSAVISHQAGNYQNGTWLVDPISRTTDFSIDLASARK